VRALKTGSGSRGAAGLEGSERGAGGAGGAARLASFSFARSSLRKIIQNSSPKQSG